jgi:uncharacterized membrane protein YhaH (DUF805 family)
MLLDSFVAGGSDVVTNAAAAAKPSAVLDISIGVGLLIIALTAQVLIWKRLQDAKLRTVYAWIAWTFAVIGGTAMSSSVGSSLGITGSAAIFMSLMLVLILIVDLKDHRPDWPAFVIIIVLPTLMRLSNPGPIGDLFALVLKVPDFGVQLLMTAFGV